MKNFLPHLIREQYENGILRGTFDAYTMFIDLSGFTAMTEALMREGNEGAEKLSRILNSIFSPLVELVYQRGGFIPYFAGDAFTAIFPKREDPSYIHDFLLTAEEISRLVSSPNFRFEEFRIGMKIGLSYGQVQWGIVGASPQSYYFRGPAIDRCAESQMHATFGEIVLDKYLQAELPPTVHATAHGARGYYLLSGHLPFQAPLFQAPDNLSQDMPREILERFLPDSVLEFNEEGEFRSVVSIFCSFTGVEDHETMNRFSTIFLDLIANFSGYFKEIDFGDKGGVMVGFFGAPVTFENNVARALEFVSTLREELLDLQTNSRLAYRIGITSGIAYTGMVGGEERCQYAAVGNRVNLAARLMTHADWGEALVDDEVRKNRHFSFKHKGDIAYKGVPGPVPTYIFLGRNLEQEPAFAGNMVGRDRELAEIYRFAIETFQYRHAAVASIFGEAGIGKSRLVFELRKKLQEGYPVSWLTCLADQILRKPFNAFTYCLKNYFDQAPEFEAATNLKHFEQWFNDLTAQLQQNPHPEAPVILRELLRTKPILAALVGLKTEDSIWQSLDARGKYQNTIAAISNLILAESIIQPTVLELEDAHWLDDSSRDFLEQFLPRLAAFPILVLISARYADDGSKPQILPEEKLENRHIHHLVIDLNTLQPETLRSYAEGYLKGPISKEFFELLQRTTNGNPFYLEQLLEYFSESSLMELEDGLWNIKDHNIRLSNSIQAILTARLDRLSALVRETVKAAAVIGREFEVPVLTEVMKNQEAFSRANGNTTKVLQEQIRIAEKSQIWRAMNELRYIFKHSLLREAVYDMQLRTRLRELHLLIAEAIEKIYASQLEDHLVDLAFHYEQAEVLDKTMEYLQKAAEHARQYYQNQQALTCYDKMLEILGQEIDDKSLEIQTLLSKGKVLELTGEWDEANTSYHSALKLSRELGDKQLLGRANNSLGHLLLLQGEYKDARLYLEVSASFFEALDDRFGIAKVYGDLGNLFFRQGNYDSAKSYFTQSIQHSRELTYSPYFTQIVANLALAHMNQGAYDEGLRWLSAQLALAQENQDKQGMATLFTNMGIVNFEKGDYNASQECHEQGLELADELGNKLLTAIAMGCLGSVRERKGDFAGAMEHFQKDLDLAEELGDPQGIAIAHSLLGELLTMMGRFEEGIPHVEKAHSISRELGYKKGIAKAANTLGDAFYFMGDFDRSLEYYNQAIDLTREINNKLVLGSSLAEKSLVLIDSGQLEESRIIFEEALALAIDLGNPDLLLEIKLLGLRIAKKEGKKEEVLEEIRMALPDAAGKAEKAAFHFLAFETDPNPENHRQALDLYRELFAQTPKYLYQQRIAQLETWRN